MILLFLFLFYIFDLVLLFVDIQVCYHPTEYLGPCELEFVHPNC